MRDSRCPHGAWREASPLLRAHKSRIAGKNARTGCRCGSRPGGPGATARAMGIGREGGGAGERRGSAGAGRQPIRRRVADAVRLHAESAAGLPGYRAWAAAACRKAGRLAADVLDPPMRHAVTEALDGYVAHRRRNGIEVGGRVASGDPDGRTSFAKTRDALPRSIERQILAGRDAASASATASNESTRDALPGECRVVAEVLPDCSHSRAARLNASRCDIK